MMKAINAIFLFLLLYPVMHALSNESVVMVDVGSSPEFLERLRQQAKMDAQRDISENKLVGCNFLQFDGENEVIKIAVLNKYHIVCRTSSDIDLPGRDVYENAYGEIMAAEIIRRYGADFWDRVDKEIEYEIEKNRKLEK